jgi:hypothetical protein
MRIYLLAIIIIQSAVGREAHDSPINFQKIPKECKVPTQTAKSKDAAEVIPLPNEFLNPTTFFCEKCKGENEVVDQTGMACECAPGFIIKPEDGSCIKCEDGFAPDRWRSKCVPCGNGFAVKKGGICTCSELDFEVMQDLAENGSELDKL